jgi:hypothetical protein
MLKRLAALLAALCAPAVAAAQVAPAQMGITPTTLPEVLQVLDNTKTWAPIGTIDPTTHTFHPIGGGGMGEADLLVTDPSVGMTPLTAGNIVDNAPLVPALMNAIGPLGANYDVTIPGPRPGQAYNEFYFTQPLILSRAANYHCSGTTPTGSTTYLIFAPGVDRVIQEASTLTSDGGSGGGMLSGCNIRGMDYGAATANPITPNVLTGVYFAGDPAGFLPLSAWQVGDGILLSAYHNGSFPIEAIPAAPLGTTITAVGALGGDGNPAGQQNLTLSNPVSQFLGGSINLGWGVPPKSTATFTETGSNNFLANDAITVGGVTYVFRSATMSGVSTPYLVATGVDFPTSAANLIAAIKNTAGQFVTYIPPVSTPQGMLPNLNVTASYAAGVITFTSNYSGPGANTLASVYTPAGTPAGAFGGATFSGANNAANCAAPCTVQNVETRFFQLPAAQAFKVQTVSGGNSVTVISGPRRLQPADIVVSDAFPLGTTVFTATGTGFPETVTMTVPSDTGTAQNATVTHAPGAEAPLWVMPADLKRRTAASAEHNVLSYSPLGEQMACSSGSSGVNCDLSRDRDNWHQIDLVGRWVAGNNTSTASSTDEQFSGNMLADIFEGATLGEIYTNPNTESGEGNTAKWGFIINCANQNKTVIVGAYLTGSVNACANQLPANDWTIYPPTPGGPLIVGSFGASYYNGPSLIGNAFYGIQGFQVLGGADGVRCAALGGAPTIWYAIGVSISNCSTATTVGLGWNIATLSWDWLIGGATTSLMKYIWASQGYAGYAANGFGVALVNGVVLGGDGNTSPYNWRYFGMSPTKPTANWHLQGNAEISTAQSPGGQAAWYYAPAFSTTLTAAVAKGQPTSTPLSVAACPAVTPPAGTLVSDTSPSLFPNVNLCVFSSCAANQITCTAATFNASLAANDPIKLLYPYGAAPISNDPANPDYTATTIRSGSSANKDVGGRITLAAGTATYTLTGVYATAPVCFTADATTPGNASSVSETTTVLTFTGTGTDVIKYHCIGRN